ncbi:TetR/AcrR family transcriptional regulator [Corynebacterium kroppenstedtii]|jgi:transcriptional regulator, tetR family|uniref:HTH tetR-type domain-containing protein n=1 Tax=Corynebacterium kroppenstedtii TaxID=161879 RepID=A0A2W5SKI5_9CORY|nr:TetR/AcrR family transcriptional regulator [Corynebacterium kroppenstedtii]MDU7287081.1 TetR/AcrR family transcriptional regulator [Corynebacterium kroppenstedtii]PZR03452.1 MAG: hypothetical protein DI525_09955 [Corynebacterium kroppenstedtii]
MTGLRESKKAATRQAIGEATLTVITHRGIEGLTVAAVAEEAGVSVRTFHNYFSSVNEALQYQCSNLLDSFTSNVENAPAEWDTISCFEHATEEFMQAIFAKGWATTNPEVIRLYLLRSDNSEFADQCKATIEAMHVAIAARESTRWGTPISHRSLHVCLLYELSIAAIDAVTTSFGLRRGTSPTIQGFTKEEFLKTLNKSFATIRDHFIDLSVE